MSSTFGSLNIAVSGLRSQQIALNTVGQNISNASTDGYSRQRVNLSATTPETIYTANGSSQLGTGSGVQTITRARDFLNDKKMWQQTSDMKQSQAVATNLSQIETIFADSSDEGMQKVLNDFYDSLQTLATNASDDSVRTEVLGRGEVVVKVVKDSASQLKTMVSDINANIVSDVNSINEINSEISGLNRQITAVESTGTDHANDLRDKRDALVDKLSALVDVNVTEDTNGSFIIQSGNNTLVTGTSYTKLATTIGKDTDYGYEIVNIKSEDTGKIVNFASGEVKGLLNVRDSTDGGVKGYLNNLSSVSQFLMQDFNSVHRSGYGSDNSTGNNFFGPLAVDYSIDADAAKFTKDEWINKLQVNSGLYDEATGLAKIAAKSAGNSILPYTKSNTSAGTPAVFAAGTYTAGTNPTYVKMTVTDSGLDYQTSTDGTNWDIAVSVSSDVNGAYTVPGVGGYSVTMYLNSDAVSGDSFVYKLDANSAYSSISVTQSDSAAGSAKISSATGTYTNGDTATNVVVQAFDSTTASVSGGKIKQIKYSTDGGKNWSSSKAVTNGSCSITINGITVKLQLSDTDTTQLSDTALANVQYKFSLSKGNVASGDNANLLSKKLSSDTSAILGNKSLTGFYTSMIGNLGVQSQNAQRTTDSQQSLINQITTWRESVSGVNMDEEVTDMIKYQKAYNAAARMLTTMDEMLDKLINGTGKVGM